MITKEAAQFLEDLVANNNTEWMHANKKRYESFKKDYHNYIASILGEMKPLDKSLEPLEVKNCTFRINRDIRFSKDKTPYKTYVGIWISSGSKGNNRSGYYVHLERDKSFIAGGFYCPEADDLKKIRREIAYFYDDLDAILQEKNFKKEFGDFDRNESSTLKNPPRGYEKDHPAIENLKLKSFEASHKFDISEVLKEDFVPKMTRKLIALKPLNDFINRAVTTDEF